MTRYTLGINTCFAVKRWPEPEAWAEIVRGRLGLSVVQHSLDLVNLDVPDDLLHLQADAVRQSCNEAGLHLHSTFTGLVAYSSNLLLHPHEGMRDASERWFGRAIEFTARAGGTATGGHVGAYSAAAYENPDQRRQLETELPQRLERLSHQARQQGLETLLVENMAALREPSTMAEVETLLAPGDTEHARIALCLDIGHQCVPGTTGAERDPYAWLQQLGQRSAVIHLQQSDEEADHHWPFTPETNARGRIEAQRVLEALDESGADEMVLIMEIIFPFGATDQEVVRDLEQSAEYWKKALAAHGNGD